MGGSLVGDGHPARRIETEPTQVRGEGCAMSRWSLLWLFLVWLWRACS